MLGLRLSAALAAGQAAKCVPRPSRAASASLHPSATANRRLNTAAPVKAAAGGSAAAPAAAGNATESLADAHARLAGVQPYLVSTQQPVELVSLWGDDERAVVFFARHFVSAGGLGPGLGLVGARWRGKDPTCSTAAPPQG